MAFLCGRRSATLVGGLALAVGCPPAGASATTAQPTDHQVIDAINLTPADVPGFEASPAPVVNGDPPEASRRCRRPRFGTPQAPGVSAIFTRDTPTTVELHSQVFLMPTGAAATRYVRAVRRAWFRSCMVDGLAAAFERATHHRLRVTRATARPLAVHPPAMAGVRLRMGLVRAGRHSISVSDLRWLARDRVVVMLETSTIRMPYPAAEADRLMAILADRAATALPDAPPTP